MIIRAATENDLPSVLSLYSQPELDDGQVLNLGEAREIFGRFSEYPNYRLFVAEYQSRVVGTFALLVMDNLGHLGSPSSVVEDVAVQPEYQGKGIGRSMLQYAIEESRRAGCYKMTLSANLRREAAHKFYESLGFTRHGYSYQIEISA